MMASFGSSMSICRISFRFFSPPENPSFRYLSANLGSICMIFIFSWMSRYICIGASSSSRTELTAVRRKFATETPGHLARVLEGEEHAEPRPLVGLELQHVLAHELDGAVRDLVARMAHEHVRERALARPVRAHDGVDLALAHLEVEALEDLAALDLDVQVVYL